jgi:GNAT superfamily N-acetyltransferase
MYDIVPYDSKHFSVVMELLKELWGHKTERYFEWKYLDNPYGDFTGIVAFDANSVIGFRGYMATPWEKDEKQFIIPVAGDTIVHKDYRKQGLSVAMGLRAEEELSDYPAILNFSCGGMSHPGYERLGFEPLHNKTLRFCKGTAPNLASKNTERVYVIDRPRPMPAGDHGKIRPVRDDRYWSWRLKSNTEHTYEFYCMDDDYILLGVTPDRTASFILDYTENNLHTIEIIIYYIFKHVKGILSVHHFGASEAFDSLLNKFRFQRKERAAYWPVMVKPLREDISTDKNDWALRGICSDIL